MKSFEISKWAVHEAFRRVRANKGAAGVDGVSLAVFESDLKNNLYKIWNRMSSGTYFPPPVRAVEIPKSGGGVRVLGVPTVADRVAQTVVAMELEKRVEPKFHPGSYGYRPKRSALDAVATCRQRCWKSDWVIDLDIAKFFDTVDHDLMVKAVRANTDQDWVVLYVQRWLCAPLQRPDGTLEQRDRGTPQGSAVSPVLANLFMHYAFDAWMAREFPHLTFERYVDDAVVHCTSLKQAQMVRDKIGRRLTEVGLSLHPDKTKIVYCRDGKRRNGSHEHTSFTFLGYEFRIRGAQDRHGRKFSSFLPAISKAAEKAINREVRSWKLHLRNSWTLGDLARWINPIVRGWLQYYGRFYRSELYALCRRINTYLMRWARKKYRKIHGFRKAHVWWKQLGQRYPRLFAQWQYTRGFMTTGW
ncbi:group II intron reverse transcriptase/maturase [Nocardia pseudovaccinii]|uniref:group II intron reverse transcriptase/maturase n=1 Tax=Nocardia pseudovaccinii TaxID=189540 RepID=UPI003D8B9037